MKLYIAAILTCLTINVSAQTSTKNPQAPSLLSNRIDVYLTSAVEAYKFNGVALVAKGGTVLLHKGYGWKNVTTKSPNDTSTRFPILSITKSFTALVLLHLQEQGKLSLKDPLSKYFPDIPEADKIKLEHLLTHSSGLFNYTDNISESDTALVGHPVSRQLVLDQFISKPLTFKPGKEFSYNNSGYYLAGLIIEKVTGKPYEQVVRELVFQPLKMNSSGFDYLGLPNESKAVGYQFLDETVQKPYPFYDSTVGYAAGSTYSTTSDMLKWATAIASQQLLSSASWQTALEPKVGDYGYGFMLGQYGGKRFIKHAGGYPGFTSEFIHFPSEALTIILLRNVGTYGQDLWPVTMGLSNIMFGAPYDLWKARKKVQLPDSVLQQRTGIYGVGNSKISFLVKDGQLHAVLGNNQYPLLAESDDVFYLENYNTQLTFEKDASGQPIKIIIRENGKNTEVAKAK
jgi:CubicO group peptidase (beta-lactamase class C family)